MSKRNKKSAPANAIEHVAKRKTMKKFIVKNLILFLMLTLTVAFCDYKDYFEPNIANNHTKRKWDTFYDMTTSFNIDILMIGNSHLYTGINPKTLSACMNSNSFILASPGTNVGDYYYTLKEALKSTKPNIVVIETFGIYDFNPYELKGADLSDQIKSFSARKDIPTKLASTPFLYDLDNYIYILGLTLSGITITYLPIENKFGKTFY